MQRFTRSAVPLQRLCARLDLSIAALHALDCIYCSAPRTLPLAALHALARPIYCSALCACFINIYCGALRACIIYCSAPACLIYPSAPRACCGVLRA
jgi:hypothetical protein